MASEGRTRTHLVAVDRVEVRVDADQNLRRGMHPRQCFCLMWKVDAACASAMLCYTRSLDQLSASPRYAHQSRQNCFILGVRQTSWVSRTSLGAACRLNCTLSWSVAHLPLPSSCTSGATLNMPAFSYVVRSPYLLLGAHRVQRRLLALRVPPARAAALDDRLNAPECDHDALQLGHLVARALARHDAGVLQRPLRNHGGQDVSPPFTNSRSLLIHGVSKFIRSFPVSSQFTGASSCAGERDSAANCMLPEKHMQVT